MPEPAQPSRDETPAPAGVNAGRLLLELAGAGAGILLFVNLVGGLVWQARLSALELPAESTVALLPGQTILLAGVRLILPSLALGVVVLISLSLVPSSTLAPGWLDRRHRRTAFWAAAAVVVALVTVYNVTQTMTAGKRGLVLALTAGVLVLAALVAWKGASVKAIGATLFALVAVHSGVVAYLRASDPPVSLPFVVIQTKDGGRTSGFLLARSADEVIMAPDVELHTIRRVAAVPRDDIADLRLTPGPDDGVRPLPPYTGPRVVLLPPPPTSDGRGTVARARAFLASVRGSTLWKYPPIMFSESAKLWKADYAGYAATPMPWSDDGVEASLVQLNEETNLFDGRVVITDGIVLAVTAPPRDSQAMVRQFIAVRSPASANFRAVCPVANAPDLNLSPGDRVRIRGIVLAAGIFVGGSGSERRRIAMVCSTVRRLHERSRLT